MSTSEFDETGKVCSKYEVSTLKIVQDSTNTRDLDKKFVQTPRTQPGYVGKFSIFIVVLIFLFTFQNVNNKIKTITENLPTQAGCVPGIPTDFLSKSLVFVESCTILWVDTSYLNSVLLLKLSHFMMVSIHKYL